ncbi:hypothetical protein HNR46_003749 [Haloferula luteola]|uniref:Uncharacterized protein n=1 Tax=Haloferula luteola TaxID=595692 RepID=A0A840VFW0_9BACT|nr:hypothetical protein [Haloferula luteola]
MAVALAKALGPCGIRVKGFPTGAIDTDFTAGHLSIHWVIAQRLEVSGPMIF